eukprot:sb/3470523/
MCYNTGVYLYNAPREGRVIPAYQSLAEQGADMQYIIPNASKKQLNKLVWMPGPMRCHGVKLLCYCHKLWISRKIEANKLETTRYAIIYDSSIKVLPRDTSWARASKLIYLIVFWTKFNQYILIYMCYNTGVYLYNAPREGRVISAYQSLAEQGADICNISSRTHVLHTTHTHKRKRFHTFLGEYLRVIICTFGAGVMRFIVSC